MAYIVALFFFAESKHVVWL